MKPRLRALHQWFVTPEPAYEADPFLQGAVGSIRWFAYVELAGQQFTLTW